jgi:hypothetical protein
MIVNILAYKDFYTTYVIWFNNLYKTVELPYLSGLRSRFLYANHCILKSNKRSNSTEMAVMKKKKRKMGNDKTTICKQIWTTCSIGLRGTIDIHINLKKLTCRTITVLDIL